VKKSFQLFIVFVLTVINLLAAFRCFQVLILWGYWKEVYVTKGVILFPPLLCFLTIGISIWFLKKKKELWAYMLLLTSSLVIFVLYYLFQLLVIVS